MEQASNNTYDQDLEDRIIKIVEKIKKNRNRPCYQSIMSMLEKGGKSISMDDLENFIKSLVESKLLRNIGSVDKESFCLPLGSNNDDGFSDQNKDCNILSEASIDEINDKFYETLLHLIKKEVANVIKSELDVYVANKFSDNDITKVLNKQIDFLRNEIDSKNHLIEILLKEKYYNSESPIEKNFNELTHVNAFKQPINSFNKDVTSKQPINSYNGDVNMRTKISNPVELNNRFSVLSCDDNNRLTDSTDVINTDNGSDDTNKYRKKYRSTTILGDSLVKDIKSFKMKKALPSGDKLFIKTFPGATTSDMDDYVKPTLKYKPNMIILNTGTNDLRSNKTAEEISDEIINLGLKVKTKETEVCISGIVSRNDDERLNEKGSKVNNLLNVKCARHDLAFLDNSNILPRKHLNASGLHLNFRGTLLLANNFLNFLKI